MTPALLLLGLSLPAGADADRAEKLAAQGACDDLMTLAGSSQPRGTAEDLALARAFARAAPRCGAQDKVLGLGLTERAFLLAPQDPAVVTAHAEQLIATEQRGEAASVLDRLLTRPGGDQREPRLLRGRLAEDEGEYELAVQVLDPLRKDPDYGPRANAIVIEAEAKIAEKNASNQRLSELKQSTDKAASQAMSSSAASDRSRAPGGRVVWKTSDHVDRGADRTFVAKGTKKGGAYTFRSAGFCERRRAYRRNGWVRSAPLEDSHSMIFGIDFRVSIGGGDPQVLRTSDTDVETTEISFTSPSDDVSIRVFDKSDTTANLACHIRNIQVVAL
jgi:hypothetical protein